jgi:hypothetical protein
MQHLPVASRYAITQKKNQRTKIIFCLIKIIPFSASSSNPGVFLQQLFSLHSSCPAFPDGVNVRFVSRGVAPLIFPGATGGIGCA